MFSVAFEVNAKYYEIITVPVLSACHCCVQPAFCYKYKLMKLYWKNYKIKTYKILRYYFNDLKFGLMGLRKHRLMLCKFRKLLSMLIRGLPKSSRSDRGCPRAKCHE